jgi:lysozyme
MLPSSACEAQIKTAEGLILVVRPDAGGEAIGFGHDLLPGESYPDGITPEFAETLFQQDLAKAAACVNAHVNVALTEGQFDALCDWVYQYGCGRLQESSLLRVINAGNLSAAPEQFERWVYEEESGAEKIVEGLVTRRAQDVALWNS